MMKNPVPRLLHSFLYQLGIRIDSLQIQEACFRHPLSHSLRSLSDTLDALHVSNMVCRLEFEQLFEIEEPFIAVASNGEYPFYLVERLDKKQQTIILRTASGKSAVLSFEQFGFVWVGTVLMAEKSDKTKEEPLLLYHIKQGLAFVERTAGYWLTGLFALLLGIVILRTPELADLRYLVKIIGVTVSLAVVLKTSFDPHLAQRFCRLGKHSDCNEVFRSAGAKMFGWVSLGELSLVYFTASLVWGIFVAANPATVFPWLDILALLFVGYSFAWQIYHRRWCPLCLTIDAVLIVDFVLEIAIECKLQSGSFYLDCLTFGLMFTVGVLALRWLIVSLERTQGAELLHYKHERLLGSPEAFWYLLAQQPMNAVESKIAMPINNGACTEHTLTVVMNPSCPKCAKAHRVLSELEDYRIELIFIVNDGDKHSHDTALWLISVSLERGWEETNRMIAEWYEHHELPTKASIHPDAEEILNKHVKYCRETGILGTPMILVDNRRLPDLYEATDLKYLL